jgi:hypothetical protein
VNASEENAWFPSETWHRQVGPSERLAKENPWFPSETSFPLGSQAFDDGHEFVDGFLAFAGLDRRLDAAMSVVFE